MEQDLEIIEALTVDAATLWLEMQSAVRDAEFVSNGGEIVYAVDNDVLVEYTDPHRRSYGGRRVSSAIEVFRDAPEEEALALSVGLTNFLFHELTGTKLPLILLPGHDSESIRIFSAVANEATKVESAAKDEVIELKKVLDEVDKKWHEKSSKEYALEIYEVLSSFAPKLLELLFSSNNPLDRNLRYSQLLLDGRLRAYNRLGGLKVGASYGDFANLLPKLDNAGDRAIIAEAFFGWKERLNKEKRQLAGARQRIVEADAQALAFLEIANSALSRFQQRPVKMVLITGDLTLLRVCENVSVVSGSEALSFRYEYLRTPKAYLSSQFVLNGYQSSRHKGTVRLLGDWLTLLLKPAIDLEGKFGQKFGDDPQAFEEVTRFVYAPGEGRKHFRKYARALIGYDRSLISRFRRDWRIHIGELISAHGAVNEVSRDRVTKFLARGLDNLKNPNIGAHLDEILRKKSNVSWTKFGAAAATLDWVEAFMEQSRSRARFVPALRFDIERLKVAEDVCNQISNAGDFGRLTELSGPMELVSREDPTGYVVTLLMAYLYASAGQWVIARRMCRTALELTDDVVDLEFDDRRFFKDTQDILSGREAMFLGSYIGRITARSEDEHRSWCEVLEDVPAVLSREKEDLLARGGGRGLANEFYSRHFSRFENERLAFQIGGLYRSIFSTVSDQEGLVSDEFCFEILSCFERLEQYWIENSLDRFRIAVNILGVAIFFSKIVDNRECILAAGKYLSNHPNRKERAMGSFLSDISFLVADLVCLERGELGSESVGELAGDLERLEREFISQKRSICLTDYDERRYLSMIDWCSGRVDGLQ